MSRSRPLVRLAVQLSLWLGVMGAVPAHAAMPPGVDWLTVQAESDVQRAFAMAQEQHKPVLLYWGAVWCPPCNQLKATLFNRQDFAERAKAVVPVYLDGDAPEAQRMGARFKVRGYPTMILFTPQAQELTRLPGEVDAAKVLRIMQLALSGGRPLAAVLADARAGKSLSAAEWQLLAFYSWDTDEDQLLPAADRPAVLAQLASRCPKQAGEAADRLLLKALSMSSPGQGVRADAAMRQHVLGLLAKPAQARALMDVLSNAPAELVSALTPAPDAQRKALVQALDQALQRLNQDPALARADRMGALIARIELQRMDQPKDATQPRLPAALVQQMRQQAAEADRAIQDGNERQAAITSAAYGLSRAGLWTDSNALLQANLGRSHSPYYLMSELASNARALGDNRQALEWYRQAYERSTGAATRVQWGVSYAMALVDLAPGEAARIESVTTSVLREAAAQPSAFQERNARSLKRLSDRLVRWSTGATSQAPALARLRDQVQPLCQALPAGDPQRGVCLGLFKG